MTYIEIKSEISYLKEIEIEVERAYSLPNLGLWPRSPTLKPLKSVALNKTWSFHFQSLYSKCPLGFISVLQISSVSDQPIQSYSKTDKLKEKSCGCNLGLTFVCVILCCVFQPRFNLNVCWINRSKEQQR